MQDALQERPVRTRRFLTAEEAAEILRLLNTGMSRGAIARHFRVTQKTVSYVVNGRTKTARATLAEAERASSAAVGNRVDNRRSTTDYRAPQGRMTRTKLVRCPFEHCGSLEWREELDQHVLERHGKAASA